MGFAAHRAGLARVGGKYPDHWHYLHFQNPRATTPGSIMPAYPWLLEDPLNSGDVGAKMSVMRTLGVPYTDDAITHAQEDLSAQAGQIGVRLEAEGYTGAAF